MPSHPQRHLLRRLLALLTLVMLTAAACGTGEMTDTASASSDEAEPASRAFAIDAADDSAAMDGDAMGATMGESAAMGDSAAMDDEGAQAEDGRQATTGSTGLEAQAQLVDLGRDIIYTAHLDLASTDVSVATRDAVRTIEGLGGFLFSQQTDGRTGTSQLVFKLLPEQFATALERLGSLGTVRSQAVSAEDVTAIVVDLQSRITTAEASVLRLRAFIAEANDFEIIADLENQLLDRETTLERLRGQLRSVQNQVDLATINVSIVELVNRPELAASLTVVGGHDGGQACSQGAGATSTTIDGPATLCLQLINRGDTPLVQLGLTEPVLGTEFNDFAVLDGDVDELAPGATALLIAEVDVDEPVRSMRANAVARALDADGVLLDDGVTATSRPVWIDVTAADDLPGFGEVLSGSWDAIKTIAILIAIVLVAVAPFAAIALLLAPLAIWVWRRVPRPAAKPQRVPPMPPPPPGLADANNEAEETTVNVS